MLTLRNGDRPVGRPGASFEGFAERRTAVNILFGSGTAGRCRRLHGHRPRQSTSGELQVTVISRILREPVRCVGMVCRCRAHIVRCQGDVLAQRFPVDTPARRNRTHLFRRRRPRRGPCARILRRVSVANCCRAHIVRRQGNVLAQRFPVDTPARRNRTHLLRSVGVAGPSGPNILCCQGYILLQRFPIYRPGLGHPLRLGRRPALFIETNHLTGLAGKRSLLTIPRGLLLPYYPHGSVNLRAGKNTAIFVHGGHFTPLREYRILPQIPPRWRDGLQTTARSILCSPRPPRLGRR